MDETWPSECYFGETETAITNELGGCEFEPLVQLHFAAEHASHCDLVSAMAACQAIEPDEALFFGWERRVATTLLPAYSAMLAICAGGEMALDDALAHPEFKNRRRAPHKRNPALIGVLLAAKPRDESQRKVCSDYACMLIWAAARRISPADFAAQVLDPHGNSAITLSHCKQWVRARRAAIKKIEDETGLPKDGEEQLTSPNTGPEAPPTDTQSTPETGLLSIKVFGLPSVLARFFGRKVYAVESSDGQIVLSTDWPDTLQADEGGSSSNERPGEGPMVQAAVPEKRLSVHSTRQLNLNRTNTRRG